MRFVRFAIQQETDSKVKFGTIIADYYIAYDDGLSTVNLLESCEWMFRITDDFNNKLMK